MKLDELLTQAGISYDAQNLHAMKVQSIASDSRKVEQGTLFIAVKGVDADGADYCQTAADNGAIAIMVREEIAEALAEKHALPIIAVADDRAALAAIAAAFYPKQPEYVVAVTGTNGKSSVAEFYRQLCAFAGKKAACLGTIGLSCGDAALEAKYPKLNTSPDPITLHKTLHQLCEDGITHLALEASSHGLDQKRMDGLKLSAGAFTNLSRDHLDYHATMDEYFEAKARLFSKLHYTQKNAVIWMDDAYAPAMAKLCEKQHFSIIRSGNDANCDLRIVEMMPHSGGLKVTLSMQGEIYARDLPLYGGFQVSNVLIALGLAISSDIEMKKLLQSLDNLRGVSGRMEKVSQSEKNCPIFVDYAHTPDALKTVLCSLRTHTEQKLHVVFGCGGDRDAGKRPLMGKIAAEYADIVTVTDDNPRSESASHIRNEILAGMPQNFQALSIEGREKAIQQAISVLDTGDLLVIAGKGHETTQTIGGTTTECNDASIAREAVA